MLSAFVLTLTVKSQNLEGDLLKIAKNYTGMKDHIHLKMGYSVYMDTIVGEPKEYSEGESIMLSDSVQYQNMGVNEILYRAGITCIVDNEAKTIVVTNTMSEGGLLNKQTQVDTALVRLFNVTKFKKKKTKSTYYLAAKHNAKNTMSLTFDNTNYRILQMTTKYAIAVEDEEGNSAYPILVVDIKGQTITSEFYSEKTRLEYFIDRSDKENIKPAIRYKGYKLQSLLN